jgi:Ca2+/H+ antiporter
VSLGRYSSIVAAAVALSLTALRPTLAGPDVWRAVVVGAVLGASNAVAAYALVLWGARRSNTAFFRALLAGTLGRMAVLLAAVVVGIAVFDLPQLPLVASLVGYFFAFLALELAVVHKRRGDRWEAAR